MPLYVSLGHPVVAWVVNSWEPARTAGLSLSTGSSVPTGGGHRCRSKRIEADGPYRAATNRFFYYDENESGEKRIGVVTYARDERASIEPYNLAASSCRDPFASVLSTMDENMLIDRSCFPIAWKKFERKHLGKISNFDSIYTKIYLLYLVTQVARIITLEIFVISQFQVRNY